MSKRVALKDFVEVDSVDLSNLCRAVELTSDHAQIDISGFSPTGANEYLAGPTTQSVKCTFYGSYDTGEVHQTLYPIHQNRTVVTFKWRHDQTSAVSTTNPSLEGNVQIFNYGPKGDRGTVDTFDVEFLATDAAGLAFVTTDAG